MHGVTAKYYRRYLETKDYERQTQRSRRDENVRTKRPITRIVDQESCSVTLSNFANKTWHGTAKTYFSSMLRQKIAGSAARIASMEYLSKVLRPKCLLQMSALRIYALRILGIIASIIPSVQQEPELDEEVIQNT